MRRATFVSASLLVLWSCAEGPTAPDAPDARVVDPALTERPQFAHVAIPAGGIDLTHLGDDHAFADGVIVEQSLFEGSTGTGVFESFVRLNTSDATSQGYNTSGRPTHFDEMASANFTRDLPLSAVPLQAPSGGGPATYRELRADVNQTSGGSLLSLDLIRVIISKTPGALPAVPAPGNFGTCSALVWELDPGDWIALDYDLAPGSGNGDMRLLIPDAMFTAAQVGCVAAGDWYVYLYSEFGGQGGEWGQDDGFEEWSVRKQVTSPEAFKTVDADFDREYTWTIEKSVDPDEWGLFVGDDADSEYTVTVDAVFADSNFRISGEAVLINGGAEGIRVLSWTDQVGTVSLVDVDGAIAVSGSATVLCDTSVLVNPGGNTLPAGETLECTYTFSFAGTPPTPGAGQTLANRITYVIGTGQGTPVSYTEVFAFDEPTSVTDEQVEVTDEFDGGSAETLGTVDASVDPLPHSFIYTRNFVCTEEGTTEYDNTATIVETGQTADTTVTVNCYVLEIEKDAVTTFDWDWEIDKAEDDGNVELLLSNGQIFTLNYSVTVTGTAGEWGVSGDITITNPAPIDAILSSVEDVITKALEPDIDATVSCLVEAVEAVFPYTLLAGETLECTYSADLPDGEARLNTATAEQQNHSYDEEGASTASGTTDYDAEAAVAFGIGEDNCVEVWDDKTDPGNSVFLGYVCAQDDSENPDGAHLIDGDGKYDFTYALSVGSSADADILLVCGLTTLTNTATVKLLEGEDPLDDAEWTVDVTVTCPDQCTLTQGYWKTHNATFWGGAPEDDTWDLLPGGLAEGTAFFSSGQTWFEVFWTAPAGSQYYNLAHQYMAAVLNGLNGADTSEVDDELAAVKALFETYSPAQVGAFRGNHPARRQFVALAGFLGSYNEGLIGPGHCSEDGSSTD